MLVLTRKLGESISIGENVKIQVIQIKGKQVRLGIKAPKETKIYREEVLTPNNDNDKETLENSESSKN